MMPVSSSIRSLADLTTPTKDALNRLEQDWSPESPPEILAAGTLARAFYASLPALTLLEISSIGERVEMLLISGDEATKNAVATGFLESLLHQALNGTMDLRKIVWMLGPESKRYCRAWDEFMGGKTDALWD